MNYNYLIQLNETYKNEVYLEETLSEDKLDEEEQSSMPQRRSSAERKERAKELGDRQTVSEIVSDYNKKRQPSRQEDPEKYYSNEQVDLYDIILSHLLDEGYADTQEAAEVMMVNMSEEWRESIVEKFISPYEGKTSYNDPWGKSPATKASEKRQELERTQPGTKRQKMQSRRSEHLDRMFGAARRA